MTVNIRHIARLARLRIEDNKLSQFEREMTDIAEMVGMLPDFDENGEYTEVPELMRLRSDSVTEYGIAGEELLSCAPEARDGYISIPKTV